MGKKIRILISEPWNFTGGKNGTNILEANYEGVCKGPEGENWCGKYAFLSLVDRLKWKNQSVTHIVVSPRYQGDKIEDLMNGKQITIGIAAVKENVNLIGSERFSADQVEYFAIGSSNERGD